VDWCALPCSAFDCLKIATITIIIAMQIIPEAIDDGVNPKPLDPIASTKNIAQAPTINAATTEPMMCLLGCVRRTIPQIRNIICEGAVTIRPITPSNKNAPPHPNISGSDQP